jgi:hypothetical protein
MKCLKINKWWRKDRWDFPPLFLSHTSISNFCPKLSRSLGSCISYQQPHTGFKLPFPPSHAIQTLHTWQIPIIIYIQFLRVTLKRVNVALRKYQYKYKHIAHSTSTCAILSQGDLLIFIFGNKLLQPPNFSLCIAPCVGYLHLFFQPIKINISKVTACQSTCTILGGHYM